MAMDEYFLEVQDSRKFQIDREKWREDFRNWNNSTNNPRELHKKLDAFHYTYHWEWLGVPIIKLPDDVMVLQEFYFQFKPTAVIEVGVARGGGMALAASLQDLTRISRHILGIDLKIFPHTIEDLKIFGNSGMKLLECDSTNAIAKEAAHKHIAGHKRVFVTLDSDHSHAHVLKELEIFGEILPKGSVILVADTVIEDFVSENTERNWGPGNSPKSALDEFLRNHPEWEIEIDWSRRAAISESHDGWIKKVAESPI